MDQQRLAVVWSSADREVARSMVFMYVRNARKQGWFDEVLLVIWGPSGRLLVDDKMLRMELTTLTDLGVKVEACKACSDMYGISDQLSELGVDVKYMGVPLSDMLKGDWKVLTF